MSINSDKSRHRIHSHFSYNTVFLASETGARSQREGIPTNKPSANKRKQHWAEV